MGKTGSLCVGDDYRLPGLLQRSAHARMPSPGSFSLVHKRDLGAIQSYHLFSSAEACDIVVAGVQVHNKSITPDMITLQVGHSYHTQMGRVGSGLRRNWPAASPSQREAFLASWLV
jgi:hypothetical protein